MNELSEPDHEWLSVHGPRLVLMARQWVACHADAQDVVQTAFVRYWQRRDGVRDPLPYLYQTVRTTAMNFNRSQQEDSAWQKTQRPEPMFLTPADHAGLRDLSERATRALAGLPVDQREVIAMRMWGQLSFEVIGQVLDIPPRTAQSRYLSGIESMRTLFENDGGSAK